MKEHLISAFSYAIHSFSQYFGEGYLFPLFLLALAFIIINRIRENNLYARLQKKNSTGNRQTQPLANLFKSGDGDAFLLLFQYPLLALLVIFTPLVTLFVINSTTGFIYWRLFWVLLLPVTISFAFTLIIRGMSKTLLKYISVFLSLFLIIFSGKMIFTSENYSKADNLYKLPAEVITVCNIVTAGDKKDIRIVVPSDLDSYVRQYNANIHMVSGRNGRQNSIAETDDAYKLYRLVNAEEINFSKIVVLMRYFSCDYLVISINKPISEDPASTGLTLIGATESYLIYNLHSAST